MILNKLYRRCFSYASPQPCLLVVLGNPGDKYKETRHNAGFDMIDAFAESQGIPMDTVHCKAIFGKGFVDDVPVFLAKPQTYMNLSGESLITSYLLIMWSCSMMTWIYHVGCCGFTTKEVMQAIMGIGRPPGQMDPKAFLLQKFNATARGRIDAALEEGVGALKQLMSTGLTETARSFNTVQKYMHIRLQTLPS